MVVDPYDSALGHLHAAMAAMAESGDTLATAMIAQAIDVVEQSGRTGGLPSIMAQAGNRRPC